MNPQTVLGGCECHERALLAVFRGVTACPCVPLQPQGQADDAQHRSSEGDAGEVPTLISLKLKPSCSVPLLQCSCRSWGLLKLTAPCPPQGAECPQKLGPAARGESGCEDVLPAEPLLQVTSTALSLAVQPRNPGNGPPILQCPPEPGICFKVGDVGVWRLGNNGLYLEEWGRGTA